MRKVDELSGRIKEMMETAIEVAIAKATTASQRYYDNAVTEGHSKMHIHYIKYLSVSDHVEESSNSSLMTAGAREKAHLPIPPYQSIYNFLSAYVTAITELNYLIQLGTKKSEKPCDIKIFQEKK
uniref:Uncharacterized protein n=1 Tax=Brugia malayi TaxID=6279 RepID=A8PYN2_BRUMA